MVAAAVVGRSNGIRPSAGAWIDNDLTVEGSEAVVAAFEDDLMARLEIAPTEVIWTDIPRPSFVERFGARGLVAVWPPAMPVLDEGPLWLELYSLVGRCVLLGLLPEQALQICVSPWVVVESFTVLERRPGHRRYYFAMTGPVVQPFIRRIVEGQPGLELDHRWLDEGGATAGRWRWSDADEVDGTTRVDGDWDLMKAVLGDSYLASRI